MSAQVGDLLGDRGAEISSCGRYRYRLWRWWDPALPSVVFVMLNPSTADALADDQTIRKCVGFARRWGAGGIRVVNLYAWRATKPTDLAAAAARGEDVVGEFGGILNRNDSAIVAAPDPSSRIIAAWGAWPGPFPLRPARVQQLLGHLTVEALGLTKHGAPRHPLYVRGDVEPVPYWKAMARAA